MVLEGWASAILAQYLGHFIDVKKEKLQISLWSAWRTGFVLENVKLKVRAFDYLQLPFTVKEGSVGRLSIQIPWHALRSRPMVIELSDVYVTASPRQEAEWEEGPARDRAQAFKQAQLSAMDMERLSKPQAQDKAGGTANAAKGGGWSFWTHFGRLLLNKLQLSIANVHICFKEFPREGQPGTQVGLRLQELQTSHEHLETKPNLVQGTRIARDLMVQQLSLYWHIGQASNTSENSAELVEAEAAATVLRPLNCVLQLSMLISTVPDSMPGPSTVFEAAAKVQHVEVHLQDVQAGDMLRLADEATIWGLRSKYAMLRPPGWRSDPAHKVSWRRVWQYAIRAVMMDTKQNDWPMTCDIKDWRRKRNQYIRLYQRKLELMKHGPAGVTLQSEDEKLALAVLEGDLSMGDILLFRSLAEAASGQSLLERASSTANSELPETRQRGWIAWAMSSTAGYLGYVPSSQSEVVLPEPPSDADIQELYNALDFDPRDALEERTQPSYLRTVLRGQVAAAVLSLSKAGPNGVAGGQNIIALEVHDCQVRAEQHAEEVCTVASIQDAAVYDLCSHDAGISEQVISRWIQGGTATNSTNHEDNAAILASLSIAPTVPLLELHYTSGPAPHLSAQGNEMQVTIQPLQVMHRPTSFTLLQSFLSHAPTSTYGSRMAEAANQLSTAPARTLAKAEMLAGETSTVSVVVQLKDLLLVACGGPAPAEAPCTLLHSGPVRLHKPAHPDGVSPSRLLRSLQLLCRQQATSGRQSPDEMQALLWEVEKHILYQHLEVEVAGLELATRLGLPLDSSPLDGHCTPVLSPLHIAATISRSKVPRDAVLPDVRVEVEAGALHVTLDANSKEALMASIATPDGSNSGIIATAESLDNALVAKYVPSSAPAAGLKLELHATLPSVCATLQDRVTVQPDATDAELRFAAGTMSVRLQSFNSCTRVKLGLDQARFVDASKYRDAVPAVRGLWPRLARQMLVQRLAVRVDQGEAQGLLVSVQLDGTTAQGFGGELGNYIKRVQPHVPAVGYVTFHRHAGSQQFAVSLQDVGIGVAMLMRIAAVFRKPDEGDDGQASCTDDLPDGSPPHGPSDGAVSPPTYMANNVDGVQTAANAGFCDLDRSEAHNLHDLDEEGLVLRRLSHAQASPSHCDDTPLRHNAQCRKSPDSVTDTAGAQDSQDELFKQFSMLVRNSQAAYKANRPSKDGPEDVALLDVPYLLLQLPAHQPMEHPSQHPVQEPPASWRICPMWEGPVLADDQQPIVVISNAALYVAGLDDETSSLTSRLPFMELPDAKLIMSPEDEGAPNDLQSYPVNRSFALEVMLLQVSVLPSQLTTAGLVASEQHAAWTALLGGKAIAATEVHTTSDDQHKQHSKASPVARQPAKTEQQQTQLGEWSLQARLVMMAVNILSSVPASPAVAVQWQDVNCQLAQQADYSASAQLSWSQLALRLNDSLQGQQSPTAPGMASSPFALNGHPSRGMSGGSDAAASGREAQVSMAGRSLATAHSGPLSLARMRLNDPGLGLRAAILEPPGAHLQHRQLSADLASASSGKLLGSVMSSGGSMTGPAESAADASASSDDSNGAAYDFQDADDYDTASFVSATSNAVMLASSLSVRDMRQGADSSGVMLLGVTGSTPGSRASISCLQGPATNCSPQQLDVSSSNTLVRAFLDGWQAALQILEQHAIAVSSAFSLDMQDDSVSHQIPAPSRDLTIELVNLQAQMVANNLAGGGEGGPSSPCLDIKANADIQVGQIASGPPTVCCSRAEVQVSTALIQLAADMCKVTQQMDAGVFMGLTKFTVAFQPSQQGKDLDDDASVAWQLEASVAAISVWASFRHLCVLAAILQALKLLQEAPSTEVENKAADGQYTLSTDTKAGSRVGAIAGKLQLRIGKVALLLTNDKTNDQVPILEGAVSAIEAEVCSSTGAGDDLITASLQAQVLLDVYNNTKMGWEPAVEPWAFSVQLASSSPGDAAAKGGPRHSLGLRSANILELTAGLALTDAAGLVQEMLAGVMSVAQQPLRLEGAVMSAGDGVQGGHSPYWLHNMTGASLEYWLSSDARQALPMSQAAVLWSPNDAAVALPAVPAEITQQYGRHVGPRPSSVDSARHVEERPAGDIGHRQNAQQLRQTLLCFRLSHHAHGPVALDHPGLNAFEVRRTPGGAVRHVVAQVEQRRHGGHTLLLHSGLSLRNNTQLPLRVGWRLPAAAEPTVFQVLQPLTQMWLPVLRPDSGGLCLQPAGMDSMFGYTACDWSQDVMLDEVLPASAGLPGHPEDNDSSTLKWQLTCQQQLPSQAGLLPGASLQFCVLAAAAKAGVGWDVTISPPLVLQNALPVPVQLYVKGSQAWNTHRVRLQPRERMALHQLDSAEVETVTLQPAGFEPSLGLRLPALLTSAAPDDLDAEDMFTTSDGDFVREEAVQVVEIGEAHQTCTVYLQHLLEAASGSHVVRLRCALWVCNCTGLPLALQQSKVMDEQEYEDMTDDDEVPQHWLAPYAPSSSSGAAPLQRSPRSSLPRSGSASSVQKGMTSRNNLVGLGAVLTAEQSSSHRYQPTGSSANRQGIAQSMDMIPSFHTPRRWPSIVSGLTLEGGSLNLQLRATPIKAPRGSTYWSAPLQLDALGGAALLTVPCPISALPAAAAAHSDTRGAYIVSVTATQVEGGAGALSVQVVPRYVLHNTLDVVMLYRQQASLLERELAPGVPRAVHWPDMTRPLRLCLRVQEAGWLWSGGVSLDTPGDQFVNIRHGDRGVTMLVRVDVSTGPSGELHAVLSHQAAGFAPYRIDNCSAQVLHLRQAGCPEQEDVLRPYCSLPYAWDEPSQPHLLVLELPGNRKLGTFHLDKVGSSTAINLAGDGRMAGSSGRKLQVVVCAEGPTRVLLVQDLLVHPTPAPSPAQVAPRQAAGWEAWSGSAPLLPPLQAVAAQPANIAANLLLEVRVEAAGVGLSLVSTAQELLYARLSGIKLRLGQGSARSRLEVGVRGLQVDNPLPGAVYPVLLSGAVPPFWSGAARASQAMAALPRHPALTLRAAVWSRRPAGVICVELLEVRVAPLALEVEQRQLAAVASFLTTMLEPLTLLPTPDASRRLRHEPDLAPLLASSSASGQSQQQKIYIEQLTLAGLEVSFSFLPAATWDDTAPPGVRRVARILQVADVEGVRLRLAGLELRHPLLSRQALAGRLSSHYTRALLSQAYKLLASADLLGDPVRLLHHLGLGFWSFLSEPAAGLVQSARGRGLQQVARGLRDGTRSLITNTVFALSNASAKMSAAVRKGLLVLGLEHPRGPGFELRQRTRWRGPPGPYAQQQLEPGFVNAVLAGLVGLLSEPVRGVEEGGLLGLLRGTLRGAIGVLVGPLASALEASARMSDSIRTAVTGGPPARALLRPPRLAAAAQPLEPYSYADAVGRYLLHHLQAWQLPAADFRGCMPLADPTSFIILTSRHVACIHLAGLGAQPSLSWVVALEDIEYVRRHGEAALLLLALRPAWPGRSSPAQRMLQWAGTATPDLRPFFSARLLCAMAQDAATAELMLRAARRQVVGTRMWVGHGLLLQPPPPPLPS